MFELSISQKQNFDFVHYPACKRLEDVYTTLLEVAAQVIQWEKQMEVDGNFEPPYSDVEATNAYIRSWRHIAPSEGFESIGLDELPAQREFTLTNP